VTAGARTGHAWPTLRRSGRRSARNPLPKDVLAAYSAARARAKRVPTVALRLLVHLRSDAEYRDEIAHARHVAARRELAWRQGRLL
jgi:hypothetical protein